MSNAATRTEALELGDTHYYTGEPCKHGHDSPRYALSGMCVQCSKERARQRQLNSELGQLKQAALAKSGGRCWYCGRKLDPTKRSCMVDHVNPKWNGGENDPDNLVAACSWCNSAKQHRSLEEFRLIRRRQKAGRPYFTPAQLEWLEQNGIGLPPLPEHRFWFEENDL